MNHEYLCTVIIPYYNTEASVFDRCMQSILPCPKNVLLLIVDDGSDEDHRFLPEQYAADNIRIIHKKNGGEASARNAALDLAEGKYILFLDSDDRAGEGFPLEFCRLAEEYQTDVLISGITLQPRNEVQMTNYPIGKVVSGKELISANNDLFKSFDLCFSVRMCFSHELIKKYRLRFREGMRVSADMMFNIDALIRAERVAAVDKTFYEYWLDTADSATRSAYIKDYMESMEIEYEVCKALVGSDDGLKQQLAAFYMDFFFYNLIRSEKAGNQLSYASYKSICDMPMFRESILLLGENHPCENQKAQILYKMRYHRQYLLPYLSAAK